MAGRQLSCPKNFEAKKDEERVRKNLPEDETSPANVEDGVVRIRSESRRNQKWHFPDLHPGQLEKLWKVDQHGEDEDDREVEGQLLSLVRICPDDFISGNDRVPLVYDGHRHVDGRCQCDRLQRVDQIWEENDVKVNLKKNKNYFCSFCAMTERIRVS